MGSFVNNLQVYRGRNEKAGFKEKIIGIIDRTIRREGLIRAEEGEEADKTIAIGPLVEEPWVTILDEACEIGDNKMLEKLACTISLQMKSKVVEVNVYDSDILMLRQFAKGEIYDSYDSNPEYFGEQLSIEAKNAAAGNTRRWSSLISEGFSSKQLREVWDKDVVFAEEKLAAAGKILNFNRDNCMLSYGSLGQSNIEGVTFLRYKRKPISSAEKKEFGPPEFHLQSACPQLKYNIGQQKEVTESVRNEGQASVGVAIVVFGSGIERGHVIPVSARLWKRQSDIEAASDFKEVIDQSGKKVYAAYFETFPIPEGFDTTIERSVENFFLIMQKQDEASFNASIQYTAKRVSDEDIYIAYMPLTNPDKGQWCHAMNLNIK